MILSVNLEQSIIYLVKTSGPVYKLSTELGTVFYGFYSCFIKTLSSTTIIVKSWV